MSSQGLNTLVAIVGTVLALGTLAFCLSRRKFGRAETLVLCVGAILVVVPIVGTLRIKTKDAELEILRSQVAQLRQSVQSVARVQTQILDVQKEAVQLSAAQPHERKKEITGVLHQLDTLDVRAAAIEKTIASDGGS